MQLILDGDIIAYIAAAKADRDATPFFGELDKPEAPEKLVWLRFVEVLENWIEKLDREEITNMIFCQSDSRQKIFRKEVYPAYKENRSSIEHPTKIDYAKSILRESETLTESVGIPCSFFSMPRLEADDVMGIIGTSPKNKDGVVVSTDKDIKTLPCRIFNPNKMDKPAKLSEHRANLSVFIQATMGDSTDGYRGMNKVGKVGAEKLFAGAESEEEMWGRYLNKEQKPHADGSVDGLGYLLTQIRMARILRYEDWDNKNKRIKLYSPPNDPSIPQEWLNL